MIRAFLVEDEADIRRTLVTSMEELLPLRFVGHASDEQSARRWLAANDREWDLAIVDLMLQSGTGLGVLKHCAKRHAGQRVVVFTSYNDAAVIEQCMDLGADRVFDKTTQVEELVDYCLQQEETLHERATPLETGNSQFLLTTGSAPLEPMVQYEDDGWRPFSNRP